MGILDLFKKREKSAKAKDISKQSAKYYSGMTRYNIPIEDYLEGELLPFADSFIDSADLTIGDIIVLWWIDEVYKPGKQPPLYFKYDYVKNFEKTVKKLTISGLLNNMVLTDKGKYVLKTNYQYVELHRNNWFLDGEKEKNDKISNKKQIEAIADAKSWGHDDLVDDMMESFERKIEYKQLSDIFNRAEKMSKEGEIEKSNALLESLLETEFKNYRHVYERLAINYRKQKKYASEIKIIDDFLSGPGQSYEHGNDKLIDRRRKASVLLQKQCTQDDKR